MAGGLDSFLASTDKYVTLDAQAADLHDVHVALRHIQQTKSARRSVSCLLSREMYKQPELRSLLGKSCRKVRNRNADVVAVTYNMQPPHATRNQPTSPHAATMDVRIGGISTRTLLDTGATCCCVAKSFVDRTGEPVQPANADSLKGIGGSANVVGEITLPVKIGKSTIPTVFKVVDDLGVYESILGQDYCHAAKLGIKFSEHDVCIEIPQDGRTVAVRRNTRHDHHVDASHCISAIDASEDPGSKAEGEAAVVRSWKGFKKLRRDVRKRRSVAYVVAIQWNAPNSGDTVMTVSDDQPEMPASIRAVVAKHSAEGGTLRGDVPEGVTSTAPPMQIHIVPNAKPVNIKQYRLTPRENEVLVAKITDFIRRGWIEPSNSQWSSSVLFAPKPNGDLRFCVDYRFLNRVTCRDSGPIPSIPALLDGMQGRRWFSALDLCSGFYQIRLALSSRDYTAFPSPLGQFRWTVMPMGLANAPSKFQQAMYHVLRKHIVAGYCSVYVDDVLVKSVSCEEHAAHLDAVLESLSENRFYCQLPKCKFALNELTYLGFVVNGDGVKPDPKKVATVREWSPPRDLVDKLQPSGTQSAREIAEARKGLVNETRRFLGFMNFFARFIPRFAHTANPLFDQLAANPGPWGSACDDAWLSLTKALSSVVLCHHPKFDRPFHVYTDASLVGIGGVLAQVMDDGEYVSDSPPAHGGVLVDRAHKPLYPIAFVARKLQPAETRYTITEQQLLAIVFCLKQWRYLHGSQTILHTDHEPLTWLQTQKSLSGRQARWLEVLSTYQYSVLYVKGDENVVSDALSRMINGTPTPAGEQGPSQSVPGEELPSDNWPPSGSSQPGRPVFVSTTHTPHAARGSLRELSSYAFAHVWTPGAFEGVVQSPSSCRPGYLAMCLFASMLRRNPRGNSQLATRAPVAMTVRGGTRNRPRDEVSARQESSDANAAPGSAEPRQVTHSRRTRRNARRTRSGSQPRPQVCRNGAAGDEQRSLPAPPDSPQPSTGARSAPGVGLDPGGGVRLGGEDTHDGLATPEGGSNQDANSLERQDRHLASYERLYDELFERLRVGTEVDSLANTDSSLRKYGLTRNKGLLYKSNRIYVPDQDQLRYDLLWWHHDVPWAGHLGVEKTVSLCRTNFWWPNMDNDIRKYCASCHRCQMSKPTRLPSKLPLCPLVPPQSCWRTIGVDLIVDLPRTAEGHDAICVFVCHLSKMCRVIPTQSNLDARGFAKLYMREIFPHYGFFLTLVSDRGNQWNNEFWREFCNLAGAEMTLSTAFHPQTNGLTERTNTAVETALRTFVQDSLRDWDQYCPLLEFALNNSTSPRLERRRFI